MFKINLDILKDSAKIQRIGGRQMDYFIERNKEKLIDITRRVLMIRSVEGKCEEGAPFGRGVKEALLKALDIGNELNFKVVNLNDLVGYVEYGEGDDIISVLGHLDVVPEGNNWRYPPFGGEIHDGKIYGRGAVDDKGPTMAALFGLYALKETGLKISKRVRIVFGTNEETGWKDMSYYREKVKEPIFGFAPDAQFPVINREKGILNIILRKDFVTLNDSVKISGGDRSNVVPDRAEAVFKSRVILKSDNPDISVDGNKIFAKGISAHASLPEKGKNAIVTLFEVLESVELPLEVREIVDFVVNVIGRDFYGKTLGVDKTDEYSGNLTLNLGVIKVTENYGELSFNIRYPVTDSYERIVDVFKKQGNNFNLNVASFKNQPPLFVAENEPIITKLIKVYEDFTGEKGYTLSIGGGTYARAMDKGVAFGPYFPGMEDIAHQANEFIGIDHIVKLARIYGRAIYELAR
jgi:succinyl-diaminopimelate desuccinylase